MRFTAFTASYVLETFAPLTFKRRGVRRLAETETPAHDITFLEGLGRAFYWQHLIDTGVMKSGSAILLFVRPMSCLSGFTMPDGICHPV